MCEQSRVGLGSASRTCKWQRNAACTTRRTHMVKVHVERGRAGSLRVPFTTWGMLTMSIELRGRSKYCSTCLESSSAEWSKQPPTRHQTATATGRHTATTTTHHEVNRLDGVIDREEAVHPVRKIRSIPCAHHCVIDHRIASRPQHQPTCVLQIILGKEHACKSRTKWLGRRPMLHSTMVSTRMQPAQTENKTGLTMST